MANDSPQRRMATAIKRHAACDECRAKKLKCKGEQPACARCVRMSIACIYSPQKQMGRPRKRRRDDGEETNPFDGHHAESLASGSGRADTHGTLTSRDSETRALAAWDEAIAGAGLRTSMHVEGHRTIDLDLRPFDGAFTPGGSLQPWLQPQSQTGHWDGTDATKAPGLTPDSSSYTTTSPPLLNLPSELMSSAGGTHSHSLGEPQPRRDISTDHLVDPSLTGGNMNGLSSSTLPPCACLSTMYLTLASLQSMDPAFPFPFALHPLRTAIGTASEVLSCEMCPLKFITAIQNTHLMGTLLMSIAERFGKVLESITTEATRAEAAQEQKKFRLADLNTATSHLHTGGIGCAAAFSVDLSPAEWRKMAKKVVRAEVHGPTDGNNCCSYLVGVAENMQARQEKWHSMPLPEDFPLDREGNPIGGPRIPKADHLCLKYAHFANKLVEGFDWS